MGDGILIKDNHLVALHALGMSLKDITTKAKQNAPPGIKVEVEVTTAREALDAVEAGADIIMLDNFPPEKIRETVELIRLKNLRNKVIIEASGNVTLENIVEFGKTGVDVISMGCITHSAPALDFSLKLESV